MKHVIASAHNAPMVGHGEFRPNETTKKAIMEAREMTCYERLKELRITYGTSEFDYSIKKLMRERVNSDRGKKVDYTWAQVQRAYRKQRGICPVCTHEMALDRNKLHGDHWDCNLTVEQGLNLESNCAATHKDCNLHKGTKSPAELSKLRQLNPTMGTETIQRVPIEEEA